MLCVKRLEAALKGGALSLIWLPLTTTAHHPWTTSPIMHCTHTFPSTITPITQLSPITQLPWLPHHTCTSIHTLTHKQHTYTHPLRSLVLPRLTFWAFPLYSVSLCLPGLPIRLWPFAACLLDPACLVISSLSAACPDLCIVPVADSALPTWHLLLPLTLACLTLPCCSIKLHLNLTTLPLRYTVVHTSSRCFHFFFYEINTHQQYPCWVKYSFIKINLKFCK